MGDNQIATTNMYTKNRRITEKYNSYSLLGKKCFIIASGPSLSNGIDFEPLKNEFTIGINREFERYPTNLLYCMDYEFYSNTIAKKFDEIYRTNVLEKFLQFKGDKVFPAVAADWKFGHCIYVVNRNYVEEINRVDLDKGVYVGTNSGFGAVMLAISMGCRDIYLLGFDMKTTDKTHSHTGYKCQSVEECNERTNRFREEFEKWAPRFITEKVNITVCYQDNPEESSLNCFTKQKWSDIINDLQTTL